MCPEGWKPSAVCAVGEKARDLAVELGHQDVVPVEVRAQERSGALGADDGRGQRDERVAVRRLRRADLHGGPAPPEA